MDGTGSQPRRISVLLVEDNDADVYLVREAMRHEGLNVVLEVARDGEKAICRIQEIDRDPDAARHDCLLIDLNIPRRSGVEVLRSVRNSVRWSSTPVIMITTSHIAADRERALQLGATDFFVKPFSLQEFRGLAKMVGRLGEQTHKEASAERSSLPV